MRRVFGHILIGGKIRWEIRSPPATLAGLLEYEEIQDDEPPGVTISLPLGSIMIQKEAAKFLENIFTQNGIKWLVRRNSSWSFDTAGFKKLFPDFENELWLKGSLNIELTFYPQSWDARFERWREARAEFAILPSDVDGQMPKKIFLSHKGVDKPLVRRFCKALKAIGFETWLDEDAMVAGTNLERGLIDGFHQSCAAVFFVTPHFKDEGFLATEINYAMIEKREKNDRFTIIMLVLEDGSGAAPQVPDPLRSYVWKTCKGELDGFVEIVRALPLRVEGIDWK